MSLDSTLSTHQAGNHNVRGQVSQIGDCVAALQGP
jgi:hypothetical protein